LGLATLRPVELSGLAPYRSWQWMVG
jgi:hypothetical protein